MFGVIILFSFWIKYLPVFCYLGLDITTAIYLSMVNAVIDDHVCKVYNSLLLLSTSWIKSYKKNFMSHQNLILSCFVRKRLAFISLKYA